MNKPSKSDIEQRLLDRLRNGDEDALKEAVELYYTSLCVYSVQFTENEDESEDIVQDLFVTMWEKKMFDNISNLKMYLFISVRNKSIAAAKSHNLPLDCIDEQADSIYTEWYDDFTDDELMRRQRVLENSLKKLSPNEYEVLMQIIVNDRKYKDVAEDMNVSVNTVKIHLKRAMKKLRDTNLLLLIYFY